MKIIIDCQPLLRHCVHPSVSRFIINCHKHLLQKNDGTEWVFIMGNDFADNDVLKELPSKNMLLKKIFPGRLGWKLWYDYQLPAFVKKTNADLLITTGGIASSSSIAQCAWVTGVIGNNQSKKNKSYFNFYKTRLRKTIEQSEIIFTSLQKSKQQIIKQYGTDEKKIIVIRSAADDGFQPLSWPEKESTKTKYAGGKEYFIVAVDGEQQGLINLLKAFSLFKKRQQSNMQMVFAGKGLKNDTHFIEKLETFKHRNDVHLYNVPDNDLTKLISAAYAMVHPFNEEEAGTIILNAFKANVPVIVSGEGCLHEIAADAALYASINNPEILANQLMLLYKDENLRAQLIEKGKSQWQQFIWDEPIKKLESAILHIANQS